jgi:hypothetical protein
MPDYDSREGSKHVALPPTANKTNVDTVVPILSFSELLLCRLTQQDAYHKSSFLMLNIAASTSTQTGAGKQPTLLEDVL